MARAKKSESAKSETTPKTPAAKKRATTARARKAPKATSAAPAAPLVDTGAAAAAAARILAARAKLQGQTGQSAEKESSAFRQIKESLQKPHAQHVSNALGNAFGPQKSNLPVPGSKQVAHNQTQNVQRFNVPRRTSG